MRTLLFISISLIAFQTSAVNLGHYHQDGRKIFSNVPAKCIKNNVLVCSPGSIISNNEKISIQNKDLGTVKTKISIKITDSLVTSKPQAVVTDDKPKQVKAVIKKPTKVVKKTVEQTKKTITPIIAKIETAVKPIEVSKPIKEKPIKVKQAAVKLMSANRIVEDLTEPTLLPLSTTYKAVETYLNKRINTSVNKIIFLGCDQAYLIDNLGWETKCEWRSTNTAGISKDYFSKFIIVDNKVTVADLL